MGKPMVDVDIQNLASRNDGSFPTDTEEGWSCHHRAFKSLHAGNVEVFDSPGKAMG